MRIKVRKADDGRGYECVVNVGDISIGAKSDDPAAALNAASGLAADITAIMSEHPELAALMPPQATAALKAIRIAAWAARNKRLPEVARQLGPTTMRTVQSILKRVL